MAEIALVVADAYQRQGIGSLLLDAVRVEMMCDGIERVQVVTGAANRPVLGMLAKQRPGVRPTERDGAVLTYDFAVTTMTIDEGSRWTPPPTAACDEAT